MPWGDGPEHRDLIGEALAELGVTRLLLAIHGASFPSDPDEDTGAGSPGTAAAERLLELARALGFTGIQLGPAGDTSRDNPSPYDGTIFSRAIASIPARAFGPGGDFAGLVEPRAVAAVRGDGGVRADHRRAHDVTRAVVAEALAAFVAGARPDLAPRLQEFRRAHASWLARDALYAALRAAYRGTSPHAWPDHGGDRIDATLWLDDDPARVARRVARARQHAPAIEAYGFGQLIAHAAHDRVRAGAGKLGLALYGDLQVGMSEVDAWAHAAAFLPGYVMGAPPSRTNAGGQPWNYPVLDPARVHPGGAALELVRARADKAFAEYDNLRIDHPHGLVCPWVYRADADDPGVAVRAGARLYESPDLPGHPDLAGLAIATAAQLDRSVARHADAWVRALSPSQIDRYAVLIDTIVAAAARHGRAHGGVACEVLSTLPLPLRCVLARHGLGRWRVLHKADLGDAADPYRVENAEAADWVMLGNHDTPSVVGLIRTWDDATRGRWAAHLAARLGLADGARAGLTTDPGLLVAAMFAELLACRAENVMVFFADLFGYEARFNVPGSVADANWSLRLPARFVAMYRERLAGGGALNLPLACALALRARGARRPALIARLLALAGAGRSLPAVAGPR